MGKGMKAKPQPKTTTFTRSQLKAMQEKIAEQSAILFTACYMDECLFDEAAGDYCPDADEQIVEFWTRLTRYTNSVKDHLLTINRVVQIIKEQTGLKVNVSK